MMSALSRGVVLVLVIHVDRLFGSKAFAKQTLPPATSQKRANSYQVFHRPHVAHSSSKFPKMVCSL